MGKSKYNRFRPTSKKIRLKIDNKPRTPTVFTYQKGYIKDKIALRFFKKENKNERIFKTLISSNNNSWKSDTNRNIWDIISEFGGQDPQNANRQRETVLMQIVSAYFEKLGYSIEIEPSLNQNTPDMLVTKGKFSCYIELKAYFGKTVVGEPEVAQILKYFIIAAQDSKLSNEIAANQIYPPKFMLIHTGKLIPFHKNSIFNGDLQEYTSHDNKVKFIKKKYRALLKELGRPNNMEGFYTRNMYYNAWRKFKKYYTTLDPFPRVLQLKEPKSLEELIENKNECDVILINSDLFSQILSLSDLEKEKRKFEQIQNAWLERLIFDKSLISFKNN